MFFIEGQNMQYLQYLKNGNWLVFFLVQQLSGNKLIGIAFFCQDMTFPKNALTYAQP